MSKGAANESRNKKMEGQIPGLDVKLCDKTNFRVNSSSPYSQTLVTVDAGSR